MSNGAPVGQGLVEYLRPEGGSVACPGCHCCAGVFPGPGVPARDAAVPAAAVSAVPVSAVPVTGLLAGSIRAAAGQATGMDDSSVTAVVASLWRWLGQLPDPRDDS